MEEGGLKRTREDELYAEAVAQRRAAKEVKTESPSATPFAPTFRPTAEEFVDPLAYVESIRPEAEAFGICKIVPPQGWTFEPEVDWESDRQFGTKLQRIDLLEESRPFADGKKYTLKEYQTMADAFLKSWVGDEPQEADAMARYAKLEADYWKLVDGELQKEVAVEYGNDLDVASYWSGFPRLDASEIPKLSAAFASVASSDRERVARSGWNLNNIARWPGSVLRHFQVPVAGVNQPWLYLGMLFSTFSWHNEDNYLYSINYNHVGAAKQWYGVPGARAGAFENVVRRVYKQRLQEVPDLLHHMNMMFSPAKVRAHGVEVYKVVQEARSFVVTFPQAFHGGFSLGFNCGEAVNFATAPWIDHAKLANERYRRLGRLAVLGHDRLVFTLARYLDELDLNAATALEVQSRRLGDQPDSSPR